MDEEAVPADTVGQHVGQDLLHAQALGGLGGLGGLGAGLGARISAGLSARRLRVCLCLRLRRVLHQHARRQCQQRANRAEAHEAGLPAGRVQQAQERHSRQELTELPHRTRQLAEQRRVAQRNPRGDQAHHGQEGRRITRADQHAGEDRHRVARGEGQRDLPHRHDEGAGHHQLARPEAVHQQTHRDLREGVHRQL